MRYLLLLCGFLLWTTTAFAQTFDIQDFKRLDSIATGYLQTGDYETGLELAQQTANKVRRAVGKKDTLYALAMDKTGAFLLYMGKFDEAQPLFEEALQIREALLDPEAAAIAATLSNLSMLYDAQGFTRKAIPLSLRAVAIDKKVYGEKSEDYSYSINNLGVLYYNTDEYAKAADCFLTSLRIDEALLGEEHPDYLGSVHNMAVVYTTMGDYKKANDFFEKAYRLRKKVLGEEDRLTVFSLNGWGDLQNRIGNYQQGLKYHLEVNRINKKVLGEQHPDYAIGLVNTGKTYANMGDYESAEVYILQALDAYEKSIGKAHPDYQSTLSILAHIYAQMYRYSDAEIILRQSLEALKANSGTQTTAYSYALAELGNLYTRNKQYETALSIGLEHLAVTKVIFGENNIALGYSYTSIAHSYTYLEQLDNALLYYQKALQIFKKNFGTKHPKYATALQELAFLYNKNGNRAKAESLYLEALQIFETYYGIDDFSTTEMLLEIANFYQDDNPQKALIFVYKSLKVNGKDSLNNMQLSAILTDWSARTDFWNPSKALRSLSQLANIQLRLCKLTDSISYKKEAVQTFHNLTVLASQVQRNLIAQEDQLAAIQYTNIATIKGLKASYELYVATKDTSYLNAAIQFAENNKSAILSATLSNEKALNFGEIPDSLVVQEQAIKKRIAELKNQLLVVDPEKQPKLQKELLQYVFDQDILKKQLAKDYPKYSQLKYQHKPVQLQAIQQELLDNHTALLEYIVHDSLVYLIAVTKNTTAMFPIPDKEDLDQQIKTLRFSLTNYQLLLKDPKRSALLYTESAYALYQKLVAPAHTLLDNINRLIIVTDGQLGHLPFEALLTKSNHQNASVDYQQLPYLINDYDISYSYSAALLLENKSTLSQNRHNNGQMIAFAASYPKVDSSAMLQRPLQQRLIRSSLSPLPAVQREVEALQNIFKKGTFLYGNAANEAAFKQKASDYAVIHLAMHGVLNQNQPLLSSLAFTENLDSLEDNYLAAYEISHLQLQSDLVVLSACETGFGKFEQGEGVLSLARSFMYAGVPSLVVSLWQVNDASTAIIMQHFYQNLAAGMAKDVALRQAKLNYIKDNKGIAAHPAFWSPFIQLGDTSPVAIGSSSKLLFWGLGLGAVLLLLLVLAYFYMRKR